MTVAEWRGVVAALVFTALSVTACGEKNPLIGEWRAEGVDAGSMVGAALNVAGAGSPVIVFTEDTMIAGDQAKPVVYEIAGSRVVVTAKGEASGQVYTIVDGRHFDVQLPLGMKVRYTKTMEK